MVGKSLVAFDWGSSQWMFSCFLMFWGDRKDRDCILLLGLYPLEAFHFIRVIIIFFISRGDRTICW